MPVFYAEWDRMTAISSDMATSAGRLEMAIQTVDKMQRKGRTAEFWN